MSIILQFNEATSEAMLECRLETGEDRYLPLDQILENATASGLRRLACHALEGFPDGGAELIIGLAATHKLGAMEETGHEVAYICAIQAIANPLLPLHEKRFFFNMAKRFDLFTRQQQVLDAAFSKAEADNATAH